MDFLYPVKESKSNDSEELRYSFRSLRNISHANVFVVGEKPGWVVNAAYIPVEQSKTKDENWAMNMRAALSNPLLSEEFVLMNDDFFLMKPIDEIPNLNFGFIKDVIAGYDTRYPEGSTYITFMKDAYSQLIEMGYTQPVSYELHIPMVINKSKARKIFEENEIVKNFRSMYGNLHNEPGTTTPDVKVFLNQDHNSSAYNKDPLTYLKEQIFLSATGGSFKRGPVGDYVRLQFPDKSRFES